MSVPEEPTFRTDRFAAAVVELSRQLVELRRPLRILEAVRWGPSVEAEFLANGGRRAPRVTADSYAPLRFDPRTQRTLFDEFQRRLTRKLGSHPAGRLMALHIRDARLVIAMLATRGTPRFASLSAELYGDPVEQPDAGRTLTSLIPPKIPNPANRLSAQFVSEQLASRLRARFTTNAIKVQLSRKVSADAVAAGLAVRVRRDAEFSIADVDALEVHEGWVHLGTTVNARSQPHCTFLTVGTPAGTRTQEGLAVLAELLAGVAHPVRLRCLAQRFEAVRMARGGADFLTVYRYFRACDCEAREAYRRAARVFRGSLPTAGPFAKDATYVIGLMQLLGQRDLRFDLLTAGKCAWEWTDDLAELQGEGLLRSPVFLPPVFANAEQRLTQLRSRIITGGRPAMTA